MKIPEKKIERILELYKPECRYLIKAETDFPQAKGVFNAKNAFYTNEIIEHMTSIQAQLCLNQLSYAAFSEWTEKNTPLNLKIDFENYIELMKGNMFIIESKIQFKKQININKHISGKINIVRSKNFRTLHLALLDYELEGGLSSGKLKLAINL